MRRMECTVLVMHRWRKLSACRCWSDATWNAGARADRPYAHEVCEDAAEFFDPLSAGSISPESEGLFTDTGRRASLVERGRRLVERRDKLNPIAVCCRRQWRLPKSCSPKREDRERMIKAEGKDLYMFKNKTLLITGGTELRQCRAGRFLNTDVAQIRIFSRDEKKQDEMRHNIVLQIRFSSVTYAI